MQKLINIHTHKPDLGTLYIRNASFNDVLSDKEYYSFGIHPWDIDKTDIHLQLELLKKYCDKNKLLAVGEIGIDRAIHLDLKIQNEIFVKQLEIARRYQLPVILHCVKAWSDILSVRKSGKYKNVWIFHGFNGNLQIAYQIIKSGCFLSFGKALLFNKKLQKVFVDIPKEYFFFETDDEDLKVEEIYEKAAKLSDICIEDLENVICGNFNKVFRKTCKKIG